MGYQVFVYKFEEGDASKIDENELQDILAKYGSIEEGHFGTEFISHVGEICESAAIMRNDKNEIIGISFDRPTINDSLQKIIFDLLSIKNTCFFGPDMEFMQSRNDLGSDFPDGLLEHFPSGPQLISQAGESWPLQ
jgi:hypothetical protein